MLTDNIVKFTSDLFLVYLKKNKSLCEATGSVWDEIVAQCRCPCLLILGWIGKSSTSVIFSQNFEIAAATKWLIVSVLPMSLN